MRLNLVPSSILVILVHHLPISADSNFSFGENTDLTLSLFIFLATVS